MPDLSLLFGARRVLGLAALVALPLACSDEGPAGGGDLGAADQGGTDLGATDDMPDLGDPDMGPPERGYVVSAGTFTPSGINSYVGLAPELGPEVTLDPSDAIEVPGIALLYVRPGSGEFFVDSVSNLTLTKYEVSDGAFVERAQLGFAGLGFSSVQRLSANAFASDTRAYLVESGTLQLVTWNPTTMEIVDTEELSELAPDDEAVSAFVYAPVLRDGFAFFPFAYSDPVADEVLPEAVMLVLDLANGTTRVIRDASCGDAIYPMTTPSGDIVIASGTVNAAGEFLERPRVGASCLRRIPAGSLDFDPDYHPTIASFVDGDTAGGLVPGPAGSAFVRVLLEERVPSTTASTTPLTAAPLWSWWRIDIEAGTGVVAPIDPSAGRFTAFSVGGRSFATVSAADFSRTTLLETTAEPPVAALDLQGIAAGIGRL
ncbi:MAG: hypothetical protein AAGH15_08035 [Myxococcota bacterium]